jgi:hypothetical protein
MEGPGKGESMDDELLKGETGGGIKEVDGGTKEVGRR